MSDSNQNLPRILVFDSGLGGLSIVESLALEGLNAQLYYCADTAYFPYGEKTDTALIDRVPMIISQAAQACSPNLVIIACNTASTLALEQVRDVIKVPVIGVVPAIKPAAALTKTGTIGLLATPNTVARPYTDTLISDFAAGVRVIRHGAIGLAGAAERKLAGEALDQDVLKASITGLFDQSGGDQIDVVVLACTHYPHVRAELAAMAPRNVAWIDSGAAIARRARSVLGLNERGVLDLVQGFTSGGEDAAAIHGLKMWGFEVVTKLN
jgi:glutamate racemase